MNRRYIRYAFISFIMILLLAFGVIMSNGEETAESDSGSYGSITWTFDAESGALKFEGTSVIGDVNLDLYPSYPWAKYSSVAKTIVICDEIKHIGESAFENFEALESVTLGSQSLTIGHYAFKNCVSLKEVKNASKVEHIGIEAFYNCRSLKSIDTSRALSSIYDAAFKNCSSLESINVSSSMSTVRKETFYGCSNLVSINLSGVEKIDGYAFYACYKLAETGEFKNLKSLEDAAFYYCTSLKELNAGKLTAVPNYAFSYCTSLKKVYISSVVTLGTSAFEGCSAIEDISFIDYLVSDMGINAFKGCNKIITKENGIHYIRKWAVGCDDNIKKLVVREGTIGIARRAFANKTSIVEVVFPNSAKYSIGQECLFGCSSVESVTLAIGKDVVSSITVRGWMSGPYYDYVDWTYVSYFNIGMLFGVGNSFEGTTKSVVPFHQTYYSGEGISWGETQKYTYTFYVPKSLKTVTVTEGVLTPVTFQNISVETVNIHSKVVSWNDSYPGGYWNIYYMGKWGFKNFTGKINQFYIEWSYDAATDTVSIWGSGPMPDYARYEQPWVGHMGSMFGPGAKHLKISGLTSIGAYAFEGWYSLRTVTIDSEIDYVGEAAFYYCSDLRYFDFSKVKSIGSYAFSYCTSLDEVYLPDLTKVSVGAFSQCDELENVFISGNSVKLGSSVFSGCTSLENIFLAADTGSWHADWNKNCNARLHFSSVLRTTDQKHCHTCSDFNCFIERNHIFDGNNRCYCGYAKNGFFAVEGGMVYYEDGVIKTGWFYIGDVRCYAYPDNNIVVCYNSFINGLFYIWNDDTGLTLGNGFVEVEGGTICFENGVQVIGWRHADGSGPRVENDIYEQYSKNPDKLYYFLSTTGYMIVDESYTLGGYLREFNDDHTVKPLNGLQNRYGHLYYYIDGECQVGWHTIDGNTYYFLKGSQEVYGRAATKWMYIANKVYYFYASTSQTPYALKTEGKIGGILYEYDDDGSIRYTGFINCEYANAANSNVLENITYKNSTTRYYIDGVMQTGWTVIDGYTYYFYAMGSANGSGYMCVASRFIGGVWYRFSNDGVCFI